MTSNEINSRGHKMRQGCLKITFDQGTERSKSKKFIFEFSKLLCNFNASVLLLQIVASHLPRLENKIILNRCRCQSYINVNRTQLRYQKLKNVWNFDVTKIVILFTQSTSWFRLNGSIFSIHF